MNPDWRHRLTHDLEPALALPDPRPAISAYHDMPFAIFVVPPEDEFPLREELALLRTRLTSKGKRVTTVSLARLLHSALVSAGLDPATFAELERQSGRAAAIESAHAVLSDIHPLDRLVAAEVPPDADPLHDLVFITRAGALFPFYRTSSLLEQLKGQVRVPAILFYPGLLDGPSGLRFMGVLEAEHNYRCRIF